MVKAILNANEYIKPRTIAIVSGKGGSGKTMVAAVMARVIDHFGISVIIVDTDIATGGLTYYLSLKLVQNIAVGLANVTVNYLFNWDDVPGKDNEIFLEFLKEEFGISWIQNATIEKIDKNRVIKVTAEKNYLSLELNNKKTNVIVKIDDGRIVKFMANNKNDKLNICRESDVLKYIQSIKGYTNAKFLGIGDHRLFRKMSVDMVPFILENVINQLQHNGSWIVVDCRGGIDSDSIAVCRAVDDIILVVETDTTSYQATQHLVDTLTDNGLADKLRGFIINKVFEDPSTIIRNGTAVFRCQYLSSVPFDLQSMRDFLVGDVPSIHSYFGTHIWEALKKAYPESVQPPEGKILAPKEFREVSLTNLDSIRGGTAIAGLILIFGTIIVLQLLYSPFGLSKMTPEVIVLVLVLLGLIGSVETTRLLVGRIIYGYVRILKSLLKEKD